MRTTVRLLGAASVKPSPVTRRADSFSRWYQDVIAAADLVDSSPVKGCVTLKPGGFGIWENIKDALDLRIKARGARNAYFPLLVPASFISREAQHIEGFAKECAVVTHSRLVTGTDSTGSVNVVPDPESLLHEPLVIRPTSETLIWDAFSRWIVSHRDLPLIINQWANVVRWELRTRPFLRSAEFLWQEGHTAHATETEARAYAWAMAAMYREFCRDVLALPSVIGCKSQSERFAGANETFTCEAMMQNGWALQSATSHFLGQTFSKAFGVQYMTESGSKLQPWGTSWGASTRLIGAVIMAHSDDTGLVLPPIVAPIQVVVVPLLPRSSSGGTLAADSVMSAANGIVESLRGAGLRVELCRDVQEHPGSRFFSWERRGVPLRIELGARELATNSVSVAKRTSAATTGAKETLPLDSELLPRRIRF
jgi:prolyl-tRNA synthetase